MDKIQKLKEVISLEESSSGKTEDFLEMLGSLFDLTYRDIGKTQGEPVVSIGIDNKYLFKNIDKKSKSQYVTRISIVFTSFAISNKLSIPKQKMNAYPEVYYCIKREMRDGVIDIEMKHMQLNIVDMEDHYLFIVTGTTDVYYAMRQTIFNLVFNHYFYECSADKSGTVIEAMSRLDRISKDFLLLDVTLQENIISMYYNKLKEYLTRVESLGMQEGLDSLLEAGEPFYNMITNSIEELYSHHSNSIRKKLNEILAVHNREIGEQNSDILWHLNRLQGRKRL